MTSRKGRELAVLRLVTRDVKVTSVRGERGGKQIGYLHDRGNGWPSVVVALFLSSVFMIV